MQQVLFGLGIGKACEPVVYDDPLAQRFMYGFFKRAVEVRFSIFCVCLYPL
jgi:hypothetical protein